MADNYEFDELKNLLNLSDKGSVPINTAFNHDVAVALLKYANDNGLGKAQDAIRLFVGIGLSKAGYLPKK